MLNQKNTTFSLFARVVAMFVLVAFTSTTVAWSAPSLSTAYGVQRTEIPVSSLLKKISIPFELGSIKEIYTPISSQNDGSVPRTPSVAPIIVHLEDAHGSVEAQLHQEAILRHLEKEYGLNTVFVEGGIGDLRPELLHFFKDSELNSKLIDKLTEVGLVGGVERFLSKEYGERSTANKNAVDAARRTPSAVRAFGVESVELYRRELELFREVYGQKAESDKFLGKLRQSLLAQSASSFSKELKAFFREWLFQEEVQQDILSHLSFLQKYAGKALNLDLTDAHEQYDWPMLVRFFKLKELEKSESRVTSTEYSVEKQRFLGWFNKSGLSQEFKAILPDFFEENRRTPSALPRTGDSRSQMERFYEAASPLGFKFSDYPALSKRIGAIILGQEIQTDELFREMERLNAKILETLAKTPEEKQGIAQYREYLQLRKLFSLELTREEYQREYGAKGEAYGIRRTASWNLFSAVLRTPYSVQKTFEQAMEFYKIAEEREAAIFANMLGKMKILKQPNAILITGGFHSEGLSKFFKDSGMSYVRIAPRISGKVDDVNYLRIMTLGQYAPVSRSSARPATLTNAPKGLDAATVDFIRAELRNSMQEIAGDVNSSNDWLSHDKHPPLSETPGIGESIEPVRSDSKNRAEVRKHPKSGKTFQDEEPLEMKVMRMIRALYERYYDPQTFKLREVDKNKKWTLSAASVRINRSPSFREIAKEIFGRKISPRRFFEYALQAFGGSWHQAVEAALGKEIAALIQVQPRKYSKGDAFQIGVGLFFKMLNPNISVDDRRYNKIKNAKGGDLLPDMIHRERKIILDAKWGNDYENIVKTINKYFAASILKDRNGYYVNADKVHPVDSKHPIQIVTLEDRKCCEETKTNHYAIVAVDRIFNPEDKGEDVLFLRGLLGITEEHFKSDAFHEFGQFFMLLKPLPNSNEKNADDVMQRVANILKRLDEKEHDPQELLMEIHSINEIMIAQLNSGPTLNVEVEEARSEVRLSQSMARPITDSQPKKEENAWARVMEHLLGGAEYTVFDTETTGLSAPNGDRTLEIGAVRFNKDGQEVGRFHTLLNPERSIPPEATEKNKITDAMVASAPKIAEVMPAFLEFIKGSVLIAHNAGFDVRFINSELTRLNGHSLDQFLVIDTLRIAKKVLPDKSVLPERSYKLESLAQYFGMEEQQTHRALSDVEMTAWLLNHLAKLLLAESIHDREDTLQFAIVRKEGEDKSAKALSDGVMQKERSEVREEKSEAKGLEEVWKDLDEELRKKIKKEILKTAKLWADEHAPELKDYTVVSRQLEAGLHRHLLEKIDAKFGHQIADLVAQTTLTGGLGALMHDLFDAWKKNGIDVIGINVVWDTIKGERFVQDLPEQVKKGEVKLGEYLRGMLEKREDLELIVRLRTGDDFRKKAEQSNSRAKEILGKEIVVETYETKTVAGMPDYYLDAYYQDDSGKKVRIFDEVYSDDFLWRDVHMAIYAQASQLLLKRLQKQGAAKEKILFVDNEAFVSTPTRMFPHAVHHHINHTVFRPGLYMPSEASFEMLDYPEVFRKFIVQNGKINILDAVGLMSDLITGVGLYEHTPVLGTDIFAAHLNKLKGYNHDDMRNTNGVFLDQWQSPMLRILIEQYKEKLKLPKEVPDDDVFELLERDKALLDEFQKKAEWAKAVLAGRLLYWLKKEQGNPLWFDGMMKRYRVTFRREGSSDEEIMQELESAVHRLMLGSLSLEDLKKRPALFELKGLIFKDPIVSNIRRQVSYKGPDKWLEILKNFKKNPQDLEEFKQKATRVIIGGRIFGDEAGAMFQKIKDLIKELGLEDRIATVENYNLNEAPVIFQGVAGTIMLSDEFLEASATSMMKGIANMAFLISVWGGASPELFTITETATKREIDVFKERITHDLLVKKLDEEEFKKKGFNEGEWKINNGWLIRYSTHELSKEAGGGRRPLTEDIVQGLVRLNKQYQEGVARRNLQFNILKSSPKVDMEKSQARAHIKLWQETLRTLQTRKELLSGLHGEMEGELKDGTKKTATENLEKILSFGLPEFHWKMKNGQGVESFTGGPGLLGFVEGFKYLRMKGTLGSASIVYHATNPSSRNDSGDIFNHIENYFGSLGLDEEKMPALLHFKKELEKLAAKAIDTSHAARDVSMDLVNTNGSITSAVQSVKEAQTSKAVSLNLEAMEALEAMAMEAVFVLFKRFVEEGNPGIEIFMKEDIKSKLLREYLVRYLDKNERQFGSISKKIYAFAVPLKGKSAIVTVNLGEFVYQDGKDPKAWGTIYGQKVFEKVLGDAAAKDYSRIYQVADGITGEVYGRYSALKLFQEGLPVGVPGVQVIYLTATEESSEEKAARESKHTALNYLMELSQGRLIIDDHPITSLLYQMISPAVEKPAGLKKILKGVISPEGDAVMRKDAAEEKFGKDGIPPVMAFIAMLSPELLEDMKHWNGDVYRKLKGIITSSDLKEVFEKGEIGFQGTDHDSAFVISRVLSAPDGEKLRHVIVPIHFAKKPYRKSDGKAWFRLLDVGTLGIPNKQDAVYQVYDYTLGEFYRQKEHRGSEFHKDGWHIGIPVNIPKDVPDADRNLYFFQILEAIPTKTPQARSETRSSLRTAPEGTANYAERSSEAASVRAETRQEDPLTFIRAGLAENIAKAQRRLEIEKASIAKGTRAYKTPFNGRILAASVARLIVTPIPEDHELFEKMNQLYVDSVREIFGKETDVFALETSGLDGVENGERYLTALRIFLEKIDSFSARGDSSTRQDGSVVPRSETRIGKEQFQLIEKENEWRLIFSNTEEPIRVMELWGAIESFAVADGVPPNLLKYVKRAYRGGDPRNISRGIDLKEPDSYNIVINPNESVTFIFDLEIKGTKILQLFETATRSSKGESRSETRAHLIDIPEWGLSVGQGSEAFNKKVLELLQRIFDKDGSTGLHGLRVMVYSLLTARQMGLDLRGAFGPTLAAGALLHDLGKIKIPERILKATDEVLSALNYQIMKKHTVFGAKIVEGLNGFKGVRKILLHHHEWFNGKGYPEGFAGGMIPVGARIVAVADAFDTIVSERGYKEPEADNEAILTLKKQAGTQFDPRVVGAFLKAYAHPTMGFSADRIKKYSGRSETRSARVLEWNLRSPEEDFPGMREAWEKAGAPILRQLPEAQTDKGFWEKELAERKKQGRNFINYRDPDPSEARKNADPIIHLEPASEDDAFGFIRTSYYLTGKDEEEFAICRSREGLVIEYAKTSQADSTAPATSYKRLIFSRNYLKIEIIPQQTSFGMSPFTGQRFFTYSWKDLGLPEGYLPTIRFYEDGHFGLVLNDALWAKISDLNEPHILQMEQASRSEVRNVEVVLQGKLTGKDEGELKQAIREIFSKAVSSQAKPSVKKILIRSGQSSAPYEVNAYLIRRQLVFETRKGSSSNVQEQFKAYLQTTPWEQIAARAPPKSSGMSVKRTTRFWIGLGVIAAVVLMLSFYLPGNTPSAAYSVFFGGHGNINNFQRSTAFYNEMVHAIPKRDILFVQETNLEQKHFLTAARKKGLKGGDLETIVQRYPKESEEVYYKTLRERERFWNSDEAIDWVQRLPVTEESAFGTLWTRRLVLDRIRIVLEQTPFQLWLKWQRGRFQDNPYLLKNIRIENGKIRDVFFVTAEKDIREYWLLQYERDKAFNALLKSKQHKAKFIFSHRGSDHFVSDGVISRDLKDFKAWIDSQALDGPVSMARNHIGKKIIQGDPITRADMMLQFILEEIYGDLSGLFFNASASEIEIVEKIGRELMERVSKLNEAELEQFLIGVVRAGGGRYQKSREGRMFLWLRQAMESRLLLAADYQKLKAIAEKSNNNFLLAGRAEIRDEKTAQGVLQYLDRLLKYITEEEGKGKIDPEAVEDLVLGGAPRRFLMDYGFGGDQMSQAMNLLKEAYEARPWVHEGPHYGAVTVGYLKNQIIDKYHQEYGRTHIPNFTENDMRAFRTQCVFMGESQRQALFDGKVLDHIPNEHLDVLLEIPFPDSVREQNPQDDFFEYRGDGVRVIYEGPKKQPVYIYHKDLPVQKDGFRGIVIDRALFDKYLQVSKTARAERVDEKSLLIEAKGISKIWYDSEDEYEAVDRDEYWKVLGEIGDKFGSRRELLLQYLAGSEPIDRNMWYEGEPVRVQTAAGSKQLETAESYEFLQLLNWIAAGDLDLNNVIADLEGSIWKGDITPIVRGQARESADTDRTRKILLTDVDLELTGILSGDNSFRSEVRRDFTNGGAKKWHGQAYTRAVKKTLRLLHQMEKSSLRERALEELLDWQGKNGNSYPYKMIGAYINAPAQIIIGHLDEDEVYPLHEDAIVDFLLAIKNKDFRKWTLDRLLKNASFSKSEKDRKASFGLAARLAHDTRSSYNRTISQNNAEFIQALSMDGRQDVALRMQAEAVLKTISGKSNWLAGLDRVQEKLDRFRSETRQADEGAGGMKDVELGFQRILPGTVLKAGDIVLRQNGWKYKISETTENVRAGVRKYADRWILTPFSEENGKEDMAPAGVDYVTRDSLNGDQYRPARAEVIAAGELFDRMAVSDKIGDISPDHVVVVLGNPLADYPGYVAQVLGQLKPSKVIIVGNGVKPEDRKTKDRPDGLEPEWKRIKEALIAIDPSFEGKILVDEKDESMNTGQNIAPVISILNREKLSPQNMVLLQAPQGLRVSKRIFEKQWTEKEVKAGFQPIFYTYALPEYMAKARTFLRTKEPALAKGILYFEKGQPNPWHGLAKDLLNQMSRLRDWSPKFLVAQPGDLSPELDEAQKSLGWGLMLPEKEKSFMELPLEVESFSSQDVHMQLDVTGKAFRENGESREEFDRVKNLFLVDGRQRSQSDSEDITTKREDFSDRYSGKNPGRDAVVLTNGNLGWNNFYVGVAGGKVYYHPKDPLVPRVMLVVRKGQKPEAMEVSFKKTPDGQVRVISSEGNDITGDIETAAYGLPLVKRGKENINELFEQLDDLRHLFRFPMFQFLNGNQWHLGMSDGVGIFYTDKALRKDLRDGKPVTLSVKPLLDKGVSFEAIERTYDAWGYQGEYRLDREKQTITTVYKAGTHPHSYFGVDENGNWFAGSEKSILEAHGKKTGLQTHFAGASMKRLAEELIQKHHAKYVWVWANGKDAALRPDDPKSQTEGLRKRFIEALIFSKPLAPNQLGLTSVERAAADKLKDQTSLKSAYESGWQYSYTDEALNRIESGKNWGVSALERFVSGEGTLSEFHTVALYQFISDQTQVSSKLRNIQDEFERLGFSKKFYRTVPKSLHLTVLPVIKERIDPKRSDGAKEFSKGIQITDRLLKDFEPFDVWIEGLMIDDSSGRIMAQVYPLPRGKIENPHLELRNRFDGTTVHPRTVVTLLTPFRELSPEEKTKLREWVRAHKDTVFGRIRVDNPTLLHSADSYAVKRVREKSYANRSETRAESVKIERHPLEHTVITLDGASASGKGTVARLLAQKLGYLHIDLGVFNRAIAEKALNEKIDLTDEKAVADLLKNTTFDVRWENGKTQVIRDGVELTESIRSPEVGSAASVISKHWVVLQWSFQLGRKIGESHDIVIEGRNAGTDIFPDTPSKFFLVTNDDERARRRLKDFEQAGKSITLEQAKAHLLARDNADKERAIAPFRKAEDAFEIDNTYLPAEETADKILKVLQERGVFEARGEALLEKIKIPSPKEDEAQAREKLIEKVRALKGRAVVLLGGPSGAGKTYLVELLKQRINGKRRMIEFSMDLYFKSRSDMVRNEQGVTLYDHPGSSHLALAGEHIARLLRGEKVELASFSMVTGIFQEHSGVYEQLGENDILVVDSIHALHTGILEAAKNVPQWKVFVTAPPLIRLSRRMIRDVERNYSPLNTLEFWPHLMGLEHQFINPTQASAEQIIENYREEMGAVSKTELKKSLENGIHEKDPQRFFTAFEGALNATLQVDPMVIRSETRDSNEKISASWKPRYLERRYVTTALKAVATAALVLIPISAIAETVEKVVNGKASSIFGEILEESGVSAALTLTLDHIFCGGMIAAGFLLTVFFIKTVIQGLKRGSSKETSDLLKRGRSGEEEDAEEGGKITQRPLYGRFIPWNEIKNYSIEIPDRIKEYENMLKTSNTNVIKGVFPYFDSQKKILVIGAFVEIARNGNEVQVRFLRVPHTEWRRIPELFIKNRIDQKAAQSIRFLYNLSSDHASDGNSDRFEEIFPKWRVILGGWNEEQKAVSPALSGEEDKNTLDEQTKILKKDKMSLKTQMGIYFVFLRMNQLLRNKEIFWWVMKYMDYLMVGLFMGAIFEYMEQTGTLKWVNLLGLVFPTILALAGGPWITSRTVDYARDRRDARSNEPAETSIWERRVQSEGVLEKIKKTYIQYGGVNAVMMFLFILLIPSSLFEGAAASSLLFLLPPVVFFIIKIIYDYAFDIFLDFVNESEAEIDAHEGLSSEQAVRKGLAPYFDCFSSISERFLNILDFGAFLLGYGILGLGLVHFFLPVAFTIVALSSILGLLYPLFFFGDHHGLRMEFGTDIFLPTEKPNRSRFGNAYLEFNPRDLRIRSTVEPISNGKNGSRLPWVEELRPVLIYPGEPVLSWKGWGPWSSVMITYKNTPAVVVRGIGQRDDITVEAIPGDGWIVRVGHSLRQSSGFPKKDGPSAASVLLQQMTLVPKEKNKLSEGIPVAGATSGEQQKEGKQRSEVRALFDPGYMAKLEDQTDAGLKKVLTDPKFIQQTIRNLKLEMDESPLTDVKIDTLDPDGSKDKIYRVTLRSANGSESRFVLYQLSEQFTDGYRAAASEMAKDPELNIFPVFGAEKEIGKGKSWLSVEDFYIPDEFYARDPEAKDKVQKARIEAYFKMLSKGLTLEDMDPNQVVATLERSGKVRGVVVDLDMFRPVEHPREVMHDAGITFFGNSFDKDEEILRIGSQFLSPEKMLIVYARWHLHGKEFLSPEKVTEALGYPILDLSKLLRAWAMAGLNMDEFNYALVADVISLTDKDNKMVLELKKIVQDGPDQQGSSRVDFAQKILDRFAGKEQRNEARAQFSRSETRVAEAAAWTFRPARVLEVGRAELRSLLSGLMPEAHAEETMDRGLKSTASDVLEKASHAPFRISITLDGKNSSVIQMLANILVKKPAMQVQVVMPGVTQPDLEELRKELTQKILTERKQQGVDTKGVNLIVTSEPVKILDFLKTSQERALVYDMRKDGRAALEELASAVDREQTLFVHDDALLGQKAHALLAALDKLFDQNRLPQGVQSASQMLAQNLRIAAAAAESILQSA